MSYNEYLATGQNNYTFPQTFNAGGRFPIIAKSVWSTLADAQGYVDDYEGSNAHVGQVVSVIDDNDNNGLYLVSSISTSADESGVLTKIGEGEGLGTITAEDYTAACALATTDNIGQLVYSLASETIGEGDDAVTYDAGLYVVTGNGSLSKLGVTSASGDIQSDIDALTVRVSTNETGISTLNTTTSELSATIAALDLGDHNVIESITVDGTSVTVTDKNAAITLPVYSLVAVDTNDGMASSYELTVDGVKVGDTINIPLDQVLSSATIETVDTVDTPYTGALVGDKYIKFVFQNSTDIQYLPVQDLVDVYSGSTYISIGDTNVISLEYTDLKSALATDLGVDGIECIKTVDTTASSGVALGYTNNTLSVNVSIDDLKTALAFEDTDTTYSNGDYLDLSDSNVFSVNVADLSVALVSDSTTNGVGSALGDLDDRIVALEEAEITVPTYTAADDTITVDGDNFTLAVNVSNVTSALSTTVSDLSATVTTLSSSVDSINTSLLNIYTKDDTYSKDEIDTKVSDSVMVWGSIIEEE